MRALAFPVLFAVAAIAGATGAASAETEPDPAVRDQARARSEVGKRHYELGDYDAAIAAYRGAYLLLPSPGVLFNLGQAYRMRGDCAAASGAYRSFLRSEPTGPAQQLASEQLPGVEACARNVESASARHDRRMRRGGLITGAIGVAALGAATYFAIDAHRAQNEVEEHSRRGGRWQDIAAADARGQRSSSLALGFAIGGGAAVVTGTVLYVLGRHQAPRERANLWVAPGRTASIVGASWAF